MVDNPLLGRWPHRTGPQYGALDTYALTVPWLAQADGVLHDWGGGGGYANRFTPKPHMYFNIDGTPGPTVDEVCDLATRTTPCASLLLRHVLEMNPDHWRNILNAAMSCFMKRMAVVNFRPFAEQTHIENREVIDGTPLSFVHFNEKDLEDILAPLTVGRCAIYTTHSEHIWYLEKRR